MRICGIDPGTRVVGVGVIDCGKPNRLIATLAIRLDSRKSLPNRLVEIDRALADFLSRAKPDVVVIERVFQGRNVSSLIGLGEGRGVALLAAARSGAEIAEYTPAEAKKAVAGKGNATKTQVAKWVATLLEGVSPDLARDATDALALALCHAQRSRSLRGSIVIEAGNADSPLARALAGARTRSRRGRGR